jgi:hypothetical protein
MSVWWEERAALLDEAVALIAEQAECSTDAALLLLKLRARTLDCDLEDAALHVTEGRIRFSADPPGAESPEVHLRH